MCKYENCTESPLEGSEYCALHIDFEEGERLFGKNKLKDLKEKAVKEKIKRGDLTFEGAKLYELQIDLSWIPKRYNKPMHRRVPIAPYIAVRKPLPPINVILKNSTIQGKVTIKDPHPSKGLNVSILIGDSNIQDVLTLENLHGSLSIYSKEHGSTLKGITITHSDISTLTLNGEDTMHVTVISGIYIKDSKIGEINILNSEIIPKKEGIPASLEIKNSQIGNFHINFINTEDKASVIKGDIVITDTDIGEISNTTPSLIIENLEVRNLMIASTSKDNRRNIKGDFIINNSKIMDVIIKNMEVYEGDIEIANSEISGVVTFPNTTILGDVGFDECNFTGRFLGKAEKYVSVDVIDIRKFSHLDFDIMGRLTFHGSTFKDPYLEEIMCRKARRVLENIGDKEEADYYFYREMKAIRKQKQSMIRRFFEWLIADLTCQYGTNWKRPLISWIVFVLVLFPALYITSSVASGTSLLAYNTDNSPVLVFGTVSNSLLSFLRVEYFSIVTATTLGYGDMQPLGLAKAFASSEAIFGMLMWAIFLAVFSRKYMR